jgi:ribonuclease D
MDRRTEKRLASLKDWRGPRAEALKLDPGVLCPNAALEAIAWAEPKTAKDLKGLPELKDWFVREFADEILAVLDRHDAKAAEEAAAGQAEDAEDAVKPRSKRTRRSGRGRSGASRAKARARRARNADDSKSEARASESAPGESGD